MRVRTVYPSRIHRALSIICVNSERALREVAILVARGVAPEEVFDAISEQAARVCGVGAGAVVRFTGRAASLVGRWGDLARETLPPGMSFALDGGGALTLVRETGLPARFDDYAVAVGAMGATLRPSGLRASAAAPVKVEGSVWGALIVSAFDSETLPLDTEEQLAAFTELASVAVAGADARERLLESRARLVKTADEERRRLERNLHDGAQQRLVSARLALRMLRAQRRGQGRGRRDPRRAGQGPRGAARARARAASGRAVARVERRDRRARDPLLRAGRVRRRRGPVRARAGDRRLLRGQRGAHQRRQARRGERRADRRWRCSTASLVLEVADDGRGGAVAGGGSGLDRAERPGRGPARAD